MRSALNQARALDPKNDPEKVNPKPHTPHPKPQTTNPKLEIRLEPLNPEPQTLQTRRGEPRRGWGGGGGVPGDDGGKSASLNVSTIAVEDGDYSTCHPYFASRGCLGGGRPASENCAKAGAAGGSEAQSLLRLMGFVGGLYRGGVGG